MLLNRTSTAAADLLRRVPQHSTRSWISIPHTYVEFLKAVDIMKPWKSLGPDNVPLDLISYGSVLIKTKLFNLIQCIWEMKNIPADLKDARVITIFKKGYCSVCGNHRGISLFSIAGKIFARILLERLQTIAEEVLPQSQCSFRPARGTTDMIFCARFLQEKSREQ